MGNNIFIGVLMIVLCLKLIKVNSKKKTNNKTQPLITSKRTLQLLSNRGRLETSIEFHMTVNMNADNAGKLEPSNSCLFLLSSHLHSHQLCFISATGLILCAQVTPLVWHPMMNL